MKRLRPQSILWFERLFLASVLSATVDLYVHWDDYALDAEFDAETRLIVVVVIMLGTVVSYAVQISLWYFVAHRASNIARWILVVITVLSLLGIAIYFEGYSSTEKFFVVATQSLAVLAVLCMFIGGSPEWFRTKGAIIGNQAENLSDVFK
ncbi:MAG: hypothetical protein Pars92KO_02670 [Parasphingorhabdus sp.]